MASMNLDFRSALQDLCTPWIWPNGIPSDGSSPKDLGFRVLYTIATLLDCTIEATLQGILARLPGVGTPTALPLIGQDRDIRRGFEEGTDSYAQRLANWMPDQKVRGNPYALMRQVRGYLTPHTPLMRVVNANGTWYTLLPDDTTERVATLPTKNWDWDGNAAAWSRIWLIIYPDASLWTRDGTWNDGETWGEAGMGTWGSTATAEQVQAIRQIVTEWKSGGAVCPNIIISFDSTAFSPTDTSPPLPDGTWGQGVKISGGAWVPTRDDRAIYWSGDTEHPGPADAGWGTGIQISNGAWVPA